MFPTSEGIDATLALWSLANWNKIFVSQTWKIFNFCTNLLFNWFHSTLHFISHNCLCTSTPFFVLIKKFWVILSEYFFLHNDIDRYKIIYFKKPKGIGFSFILTCFPCSKYVYSVKTRLCRQLGCVRVSAESHRGPYSLETCFLLTFGILKLHACFSFPPIGARQQTSSSKIIPFF